jgi:NAD(P)H-dependent FMN reductase
MAGSAILPRIAVIVGSNRRDSINRKLAQALMRLKRRQILRDIRAHRRLADVQPGQ